MSDAPKLPPELSGDWPEPVMNGAHKAAEAKVRAAGARLHRETMVGGVRITVKAPGTCLYCDRGVQPNHLECGDIRCPGPAKGGMVQGRMPGGNGRELFIPGTPGEILMPTGICGTCGDRVPEIKGALRCARCATRPKGRECAMPGCGEPVKDRSNRFCEGHRVK